MEQLFVPMLGLFFNCKMSTPNSLMNTFKGSLSKMFVYVKKKWISADILLLNIWYQPQKCSIVWAQIFLLLAIFLLDIDNFSTNESCLYHCNGQM